MDKTRTGSPKNVQSDMELIVEKESNKLEEHLNAEIVGVENTLQTDVGVIPNMDFISNISYSNLNLNIMDEINSEILIPKPVSFAKLFNIQIREIDKALIKFGQHMNERVNLLEAINVAIIPQTQREDVRKGKEAREVKLASSREQEQGLSREPTQSASQKICTSTSKKPCTRGRVKYQARAKTMENNTTGKIIYAKDSMMFI